MDDRYLWDGTGEPDAEVQQLEKMLGKYRCEPATAMRMPIAAPSRIRYRTRKLAWLAAAAVIICMVSVWKFRQSMTNSPSPWSQVIDGRRQSLPVGRSIRTTAQSGMTIDAPDVGEVRLGPDTDVAIGNSQKHRYRLKLQRGTLHALIWAPPRQFMVETQAAKTVDLGCEYSIEVRGNGDEYLSVEQGWVALEAKHREVFVPAGAACRVRLNLGPGLPFFQDAPPAFLSTLLAYEQRQDSATLHKLLIGSRAKDAMTLWHLLPRINDPAKFEVLERVASLDPGLLAGLDYAKLSHGDKQQIDLLWNRLGYGDDAWWRSWKQIW